ncbi:MAG: helix-turn-helix domain-containing protein [Ruminiclostridium sp.]
MVNVNKLRAAWIARGLTQGDVAKFIGISEKTMSMRMDKAVFGSDEIDILVEKLEISNPKEIFFPSW